MDGHKSLILLSEGLALDDQNELRRLVGLAGAARTSINVMALDLQRGDVTVGEQPPTETQDRRIQMQGLEGLATMSLGSLFYVAGTGDPIFERLSSEISAYYLLGVEQRPKDREGDRHRIDVEVRRRDVTIRSRQAFVLSPTANAPKSANDSLRDALLSPFAVSGLPLRVTTFAHHDPASDKVRLMVSAQVGQPGAPKGDFTVGYLLVTDDNRIAGNYAEKRTLEPAGEQRQRAARFSRRRGRGPGHLHAAVRRRGRGGPARQRAARGERVEDGRRDAGVRRSHRRLRRPAPGKALRGRRRAARHDRRAGRPHGALFDDRGHLRERRR